MIEPRYSRLLPVSSRSSIHRSLPTGKSFSGSSLCLIPPDKSAFSIVTDTVTISNSPVLGATQQQSPLVIEAGKILIVAIWFWCLIGANFCLDSIGTIARYWIQDV